MLTWRRTPRQVGSDQGAAGAFQDMLRTLAMRLAPLTGVRHDCRRPLVDACGRLAQLAAEFGPRGEITRLSTAA